MATSETSLATFATAMGGLASSATETMNTQTTAVSTGDDMSPASMISLMQATTAFNVMMDAISGAMKSFGDALKGVAQKI